MIRRITSRVSASLNPCGARRSELSIVRATSAKLRAGRLAVPAKITSSIPPPRIAEGRVSPMTQRSASSRFDFPQPFGPTTPVNPSEITRSVGSTKLLKPLSRRREKRKRAVLNVIPSGIPSRRGPFKSTPLPMIWRRQPSCPQDIAAERLLRQRAPALNRQGNDQGTSHATGIMRFAARRQPEQEAHA